PDFTLQPLEPRRLCAAVANVDSIAIGAGLPGAITPPASHHHFHHHYHQRHHYHSPRLHTVETDILFGHFMGTSTPGGAASLTFMKDPAGDFSGVVILHGFTFDTGVGATVFSDGTFVLGGTGGTQFVQLQ